MRHVLRKDNTFLASLTLTCNIFSALFLKPDIFYLDLCYRARTHMMTNTTINMLPGKGKFYGNNLKTFRLPEVIIFIYSVMLSAAPSEVSYGGQAVEVWQWNLLAIRVPSHQAIPGQQMRLGSTHFIRWSGPLEKANNLALERGDCWCGWDSLTSFVHPR